MSKVMFSAAKELIAEKRYAEARAILKTIDHPQARKWEVKLAVLDPIALADDKTSKLKFWKYFANFIAVLVFLILSAVVLTIYFPELTSEGRRQATIVARNQFTVATMTSFYATEAAKPTLTLTPTPTSTPTMGPTEIAYVKQTIEAYINNQTAVVEWRRGTSDARYATVAYSYTLDAMTRAANGTLYAMTRAAMPTLTFTPTLTSTPTMAVTPMPPSVYYSLREYNGYLLSCPRRNCKVGPVIHPGESVVVVGLVYGDYNKAHTDNEWYKIQITDGRNISYRYDYANNLGTTPPTPRPTITPGPSPTAEPVYT